MVGTELDITARKRAEAELRLAEAKSSGILSISADAIISIDEEQRITMFNEGAERIFGYAKAEAIGAPLDILIPERLRAIHRQHVERFAAGSEVARRMGERGATISGLRKNGEEFPADAAISKLEVGGDDHPDRRAARHHRAEARRARAGVPGGGRTCAGGRPRLRRDAVQGRAAGRAGARGLLHRRRGRGERRGSPAGRRQPRSRAWLDLRALMQAAPDRPAPGAIRRRVRRRGDRS